MDQITTVRDADNMVDDEPDRPTYDQLLALTGAMLRDWVKLNEFYNQTALRYSWCCDYEDMQEGYNARFEVMRLEPRTSADIKGWEERNARDYKAIRKNNYSLSQTMQRDAEKAAEVRATYEAARLIHDLSMSKVMAPQLNPQPPQPVVPPQTEQTAQAVGAEWVVLTEGALVRVRPSLPGTFTVFPSVSVSPAQVITPEPEPVPPLRLHII